MQRRGVHCPGSVGGWVVGLWDEGLAETSLSVSLSRAGAGQVWALGLTGWAPFCEDVRERGKGGTFQEAAPSSAAGRPRAGDASGFSKRAVLDLPSQSTT